jgi:hypothetical protein
MRTTSALYDSAASAAINELSPLVITSSRMMTFLWPARFPST